MAELDTQAELTELEKSLPPGVLDLMGLYEAAEDVYIKAAVATSAPESQMISTNSTNSWTRPLR